MSFLSIKGLSKKFNDDLVLNNIYIDFPTKGLVLIQGASGCGKSTLLKCISGVVLQDKGGIYFFDKKVTDFLLFRKQYLSFIFQDYQLIPYLTSIENVIVPLLIKGEKRNVAVKKAKALLSEVGLKGKENSKVCFLSGGQKQRVAICRSLITDSPIILCDEITGALDENSALVIMDLIKKISTKKLVIMVSHDKDLMEKYATSTINIERGKKIVIDLFEKEKIKKERIINKKMPLFNIINLAFNNLKKGLFRISISIVSLTITITFLLLIINLSYNVESYLNRNKCNFLDYNIVAIASKEERKIPNSKLTLTREKLPSLSEILSISSGIQVKVHPSFEGVIPAYPSIEVNDEVLSSLQFLPISDSSFSYYAKLIDGEIINDAYQVIVNKEAFKLIKDNDIFYSINKKISYKTENNQISDSLSLSINFEVVGVVNEFEFFNNPKVYYSISYMEELLKSMKMENLSKYIGESVSWYDRLMTYTYEMDDFSSYKRIVEIHNFDKVEKFLSSINLSKMNKYSSSEKNIEEFNLMYESMKKILLIFSFLCVIITFLLLSLILYSLVISLKKEIGMYRIFGEDTTSISFQFIIKSIFIVSLSFLFAEVIKSLFIFLLGNYASLKLGVRLIDSIFYYPEVIVIFPFIFLGIISSIIPSSIISSIELVDVIKEE